ncbi:alpha/beta-hydrolase [Ascobolus immersus RN42]|uniref:Alpha/beta-hydrolase n=1 Tax=Ascobolus immersus RN42 TaxID=1160509 RepID=A0A3N4IDK5_ASCIM|nr:alpha/beta-hydrolase [Ascobolus immersus RN42]
MASLCRAPLRFQRTLSPALLYGGSRRLAHNASAKPVELAYAHYEVPITSKKPRKEKSPLVFLHGLFGSKTNYGSISKLLARSLRRDVYCFDLRNHGASGHRKVHDYISMADDVQYMFDRMGLSDVTLIGHSMGAKVAMTVALRSPEHVRNFIAVDNAPIEAQLSSKFGQYVQAMKRIEEAKVEKTRDAMKILEEYESDIGIRSFLMTNLIRVKGLPYYKWRIPVKILGQALDNVAGFPFHPDEEQFKKPCLFIRGTKSHYVPDETIPIIGRFFPRFRMMEVDAGHWLIAEKPLEFAKAVQEFVTAEENMKEGEEEEVDEETKDWTIEDYMKSGKIKVVVNEVQSKEAVKELRGQ